jgi:hypothetical protein
MAAVTAAAVTAAVVSVYNMTLPKEERQTKSLKALSAKKNDRCDTLFAG